jgi:hypothetical protein
MNSSVIPGRREASSPESIITGSGYGFQAPSLRSQVGTKMPISGKLEIGGPGMTSTTARVIIKSGARRAAPAER